MRSKFPKLVCKRYAFYLSEGWDVIWHPQEPAKPRGGFTVTITHHHELGGDSVSSPYPGPASLHSSIHLIKIAIKNKKLPK
jgi:hypothetical protein